MFARFWNWLRGVEQHVVADITAPLESMWRRLNAAAEFHKAQAAAHAEAAAVAASAAADADAAKAKIGDLIGKI